MRLSKQQQQKRDEFLYLMSENPTVVILGTGASAQGIVEAVERRDRNFLLVGANGSDVLVRRFGKERWANIDYSVDKESLLDLIERYRVKVVIPGSNDAAYRMCLDLKAHCNLVGIDVPSVGHAICSKSEFAIHADRAGLTIPKTISGTAADILKQEFHIPDNGALILKPDDQHSGLGTKVFYRPNQLKSELNPRAYGEKTLVIQQFIHGNHFSVSAFLKNQFVEKYCSASEFISTQYGARWVEKSIAPALLAPSIIQGAMIALEKFAHYFGLCDGLIHGQFIHDHQTNSVYCLEVMRRLPGDLFGYHFEPEGQYHQLYCEGFLASEQNSPTGHDRYRQIPNHSNLRTIHHRESNGGILDTKDVVTFIGAKKRSFQLGGAANSSVGFNKKTKITFEEVRVIKPPVKHEYF